MTAQPETDYPELSDPAFQAKVAEYVARDDASFAAWLAEDRFDELIDGALVAAKGAFAAGIVLKEEAEPLATCAMISLDHRRSKPLVQALARRGIGRLDLSTYSYDFGCQDLIKRKSGTYAQAHATVEAFALALSKAGFEMRIYRF